MADVITPRWGEQLRPDEVRSILDARADADLTPLENVEFWEVAKLTAKLSETPAGVRFSAVQKAMSRKKGKTGFMKLVGKANKYARSHLRYPREGNDYYWAAFWCDQKEDDPLIIPVWQHSSKMRGRRPRDFGVEASTAATEGHNGLTEAGRDIDSANQLPNLAARLVRRSGDQGSTPFEASRDEAVNIGLLAEVLHPYRREAAEGWSEVRQPAAGDPLDLIVGHYTDDDDSTAVRARQVFVRCLPIRTWGERVSRAVVELINRRTGSRRARHFVFGTDHRLVDSPAAGELIGFCAGSDVRAAVIFIAGYRPVQELIDLLHAVRGSGSGAFLVALGYATPTEMDELDGWRTLEVAPPSGSMAAGVRPIPPEMTRHYSPLARLFVRPECNAAYSPAGWDRPPADAVLSDAARWRLTFTSLHAFIERNSPDVAMVDLANAWAARVAGRPPAEAVRLLYASGLFFPELRDLNGTMAHPHVGGPVAGAVSAYLDGVALSSADRRVGIGADLFRVTLGAARSGRRMPIDLLPDLEQLTSWMALLVAVHEASDVAAVSIINDVARTDANVALDLHGLRTGVTAARPSPEDVVFRFLEHARSHGNAVPLPFPGPLDGYTPPPGPLRHHPDVAAASAIIRDMPDLEVAATALASCAIVANATLDSLWDVVVPDDVRRHLQVLRATLRQDVVEVWDGDASRHVYASVRPVTITDLRAVFPGMERYHRRGDRMALMPWLSACLLARGCGGALPTAEQFRALADHPRVREEVVADTTRPSQMLPRFGAEWLASVSPAGPVHGREFQGERPPLFDRRVGKANWQQPEPRAGPVSADVPNAELTARPDREKLAACRVVFEE